VSIAKVMAVMVFGPVLGILVGFLVGILAMPAQMRGRAPGDGLLVIGCALGFFVSIPVSAVMAGKLWSRSGKL
jgi:hypothetical protein